MLSAVLRRACVASLLTVVATALLAAPASAKKKTRTYSSGPIGAPILDNTFNLYTLRAKGKGKIRDVNVAVRITHPFDRDLDIYLVSPRARFVLLSSDNGGSNNDYGSGAADCTGTFTVFDDLGTTPINAGRPSAAAPFGGTFRPEQPLATFNGAKAKGTWQLLVSDDEARDVGTVNCWELTIAAKRKKRK
jgi:subtilisin-like proprotein convertase family protein